jgi:hypothetical protein
MFMGEDETLKAEMSVGADAEVAQRRLDYQEAFEKGPETPEEMKK